MDTSTKNVYTQRKAIISMCVCVCVFPCWSIANHCKGVNMDGRKLRGVYVKFKAHRQLWRNLVYYEIVEVVRRPAAGPF